MAHVKPFLSPNAKAVQGSRVGGIGMGDVAGAAARKSWKPLSFGGGATGNGSGGMHQQTRTQAATHALNTMAETRHYQPLRNEETPTKSPWPPTGSDPLEDQRRQFAEIERQQRLAAGGGQSKNRSVLPPSGAPSRPANHLEINKLAQVNHHNFWLLKCSF